MNKKTVLAKLESLGDAARRKHNTKFGAPDNQWGVKNGDIRALAKQIKQGHELGLELWATGNVDAQLLASLLVEPESLTAKKVDAMTRATSFGHVAEWWNNYVVARHPDQEALRGKWMQAKDRWTARAGWHLTAICVTKGAEGVDPAALLDRIERELATAAPEVQWTMNNTLAAIGIAHATLRQRAIAIGEKVGLYRDWPVSKGCTPPFVPVWVEAMVRRQK
jgi:3-methyladenine DNA glycosylase AlkD